MQQPSGLLKSVQDILATAWFGVCVLRGGEVCLISNAFPLQFDNLPLALWNLLLGSTFVFILLSTPPGFKFSAHDPEKVSCVR